jgi:hypothetical protein
MYVHTALYICLILNVGGNHLAGHLERRDEVKDEGGVVNYPGT